MITIEYHKCTRCGLCTHICHTGCLAIANDELIIDRSLRMGYPAVSFRNKVEGKIFPIQWITEKADEIA
ncbi:MAG: hypothetical protein QNJ72_16910 [Pleurocapsa sp. MO_226.B13]|nr:hypothetical protein [Pleurocapsa sp. MO_226.B13]